MRTIAAIILLSLVLGCAQTRTFQVSLTNHTQSPITFGVVKHGEPFEPAWAPPEEIEARGGHASAENWGAIPPGKTAVSQELKGRFFSNTIAYLRVYQGKLDLAGIMAISRGEPNRLDIVLEPGANHFTVTDINGHFEAVREGAGQQVSTK